MHNDVTRITTLPTPDAPPAIIAELSTRRSQGDEGFHDLWLRIYSRAPTRVARAALFLIAAIMETWVEAHQPDASWKVGMAPDALTLRVHLGAGVDATTLAEAKRGLEHAADTCALVDRIDRATSWQV